MTLRLLDPEAKLSPRERQVIHLAGEGKTDKEIARDLGIQPGTVGTLWARIRAKLGPCNRTELVMRATLGQGVGTVSDEVVRHCMDLMPMAAWITDDEGYVVYSNRAAVMLLGSELAGWHQTQLSDRMTPMVQGWWRVRRQDGSSVDQCGHVVDLAEPLGYRLWVMSGCPFYRGREAAG